MEVRKADDGHGAEQGDDAADHVDLVVEVGPLRNSTNTAPMPTSAPACPMPAMLPRMRPLRDSTERLMPSATCVCRTVWNPRLPRTTHGRTLLEVRRQRVAGHADAEDDERQGGEALLRHAVQQRRDEDQQQPGDLPDGRDVAELRAREVQDVGEVVGRHGVAGVHREAERQRHQGEEDVAAPGRVVPRPRHPRGSLQAAEHTRLPVPITVIAVLPPRDSPVAAAPR